MELAVEELSETKRKLTITIPGDVISERVNNAYRDLNRQIRLPGFRPGKIPRPILEKQVPIQSFTQMFQELLQEFYDKALLESGLKPVGQPEIEQTDLKDIQKDKPLKFSVTVDVKPEFASRLKEYKGLKLKKLEVSVTDAEVDQALARISDNYGHFEHHEDGHVTEANDHLVIDFEGFFEGEPLEKGSATGYTVKIGEKKMIEGFESQLIGHKVGDEVEVKVILPAQWNNKMRRVSLPVPGGNPEDQAQDVATFKVKIREVKKRVTPELTDEIADREGFQTVQELRRAVKASLQGQKEQQEEIRIKEDIFNRLVKENDIAPPEALIQRELRFMIEGMKYQIEQSGMKVEDSGFDPERALTEWREKAEFNAKGYMILEGIAGRENLHVTKADMDSEYEQLAEQTGKKIDDVKASLMNNPDSMGQTTSKLLGQKAMNYLYSHAEFDYVQELPPGVPVASE